MAVQQSKFDIAERFNDFLFRSLLFGAPHFFDDYLQAVEWGKPLDKKFYQPRRHYLKRYVDAYQEILDGKLDFLSISMPKRAGKSQLGINFTNMLSGKYPDKSTLMEGTGDDLVNSFYLAVPEAITENYGGDTESAMSALGLTEENKHEQWDGMYTGSFSWCGRDIDNDFVFVGFDISTPYIKGWGAVYRCPVSFLSLRISKKERTP